MVQSEYEADLLRVESLVVGNPAADVIAETETPHHLVFDAVDGHDFHVRSQITVENPHDAAQTERFTVTLSEGDSTHGQTLVSSAQTQTLDAGEVRTFDFNTDEFRFSASTYQIEVEMAGQAHVPMEVLATREYTRPATFTWDITPQGDYELVSQTGRPSIRIDGSDGLVSFPSGREPDTGSQQIGEDPHRIFRETAGDLDPAAVTDSADPTQLTFQAGTGVDAHIKTEVTIENPTTQGRTKDVTVQLIKRGTGGDDDTIVASSSRTVSVYGEQTSTFTFFDEGIPLTDGEYVVSVDLDGSTLEVVETVEETRGAAYSWEQTDAGTLEVTDHEGGVFVSYPMQSGPVEFPAGIVPSATTYRGQRGEPSKAELSPGEVMLYLSDGADVGEQGDLIYAINDSGTIRTSVLGARADAT